jgi:hypothetical protein
MATYKLSLFALFLIVLGALIISMLVGNWFHTKEGMISFYNGRSPLSTVVYIKDYSGPTSGKFGKNVVLIYDNIFFDQDNANIIEVDSTAINGNVMIGNVMTGKAETDGSSIQNIYITNAIDSDEYFNPNDVETYSYTDNTLTNTTPTKGATNKFKISYCEMIYTTQSKNTDEYTVFVLPWNDSTYIHIINNTKKTNVNTTWFGPGKKHSIKSHNEIKNTLPFINNGILSQDLNTSPMLNTFMIQESYNSQNLVYQLSDSIFFNNNTGVLIIYKDKLYKDFTAYNQDGEIISNNSVESQKRSEKTFDAWHKYDKFGNVMVLYINNGKNIMLALIQPTEYESNTTIYTLFNVQRFNNIGLDAGFSYGREGASKFVGLNSGGAESIGGLNGFGLGVTNGWGQGGPGAWGEQGGPGTWAGSGESTSTGGPTDMMNDYYRWFYHWATKGLNNNPNGPNFNYSDDYIMKTQIVPPVCPSCPSCPATGTCTNCGGNGGSGTKTKDGTSLAEGGYENRNLNVTGDGLTITDAANTVGGVLNNAISQPANIIAGVENTIEKGASGAVDLAKDTGSGAVNLVKDTGSGAVNLAKDTASGALNQINMMGSTAIGLGKDIVGGTIDLGKDIVGGISDLGDRQRENQNQNQGVGVGVGSNQYGYANSYGGGSAANQLLPKNIASNVDHSNLYGAVPNKGNSSYMPLGSDFSKFGR